MPGAKVSSAAVQVVDVSLTLNGSAQQLVAYSQDRGHLQFQCNQGNIAYSYTNPNCGAPGTPTTGCYVLAAGQVWSPAFGLPSNAIYVNGTNGQLLIATAG